MSKTNDSDDLSKISTKGTVIQMDKDGKLTIDFDKRVTQAAFKEILEYIYTDKTSWDKETSMSLIREVSDAAKYLQMKRLEELCETYLNKSSTVSVSDSKWWNNMKWAYNNLRSGDYNLCDLTLVCKSGDKDSKGEEVQCHAVILTASCKYFKKMLLGEVNNPEKKTMKIVIDDATPKQMDCILKYIYTREFDVDVKDVIGVWILSHQFILEDLQQECESLIMKNINKDNVSDIKKMGEMVDSKRIIDMCNEVVNAQKK